MKVRNKIIWITGASSGIGEALAYHLSEKGAKLILSARRRTELERVMTSCPGPAENIRILPLDVAQRSSLRLTTDAAVQMFGHIDILINNAGISQRSLASETPAEVDRKIMEVNYFGTVELTKYLLPHMLERKSGQIVVVSSLVGKFGTPYRSGYSASKHALHGFFDSMRAELHGTGIIITIVCPGFIRTNVSVNALTETGEKLNQMDNAQAKGMAPDTFAKKMIRAVERNKREVYIGGREKYGVYLKRFFPSIFANIVTKAKVR